MDGVQEPLATIEAMAAHYLAEIRAVQPEGPYFLGGFSAGGTIAFEMAQQLYASGQQVALLAIIDNGVRIRSNGLHASSIPELRRKLRRRISPFLVRYLPRIAQAIDRRSLGGENGRWRRELSESFWSTSKDKRPALLEGLGYLQGARSPKSDRDFAKVVDAMAWLLARDVSALSDHQRRVIEAQCRALAAYTPRAYPGRITLLRTDATPTRRLRHSDLGWGKLAAGGVDVRVIPGWHLSLLHHEHVAGPARELRRCLDDALADLRTP
jgi:thioesterase domain-containing protein